MGTASCSLLLSTLLIVEGKPKTLLIETDDAAAAASKDYNNFIGVNHGGATQVSSGGSGGLNHIGVNTGNAAQFSDYLNQVGVNNGGLTQVSSGWTGPGGINSVNVNNGHAAQFSDDYGDNQVGTVFGNSEQHQHEHYGGSTVLGPVKAIQNNGGNGDQQVN